MFYQMLQTKLLLAPTLKSQFPDPHRHTPARPYYSFPNFHLALQPSVLEASSAWGSPPHTTTTSLIHPPGDFMLKVNSNHPCSARPSLSDQSFICGFTRSCYCLHHGNCHIKLSVSVPLPQRQVLSLSYLCSPRAKHRIYRTRVEVSAAAPG